MSIHKAIDALAAAGEHLTGARIELKKIATTQEYSAQLMRELLRLLDRTDQYHKRTVAASTELAEVVRVQEAAVDHREAMFWSVEELTFSTRTRNGLRAKRISFVGELVQRHPSELRSRHLGPVSIREVQRVLGELGLCLGMKLPAELNAALKKRRKP